MNRHSFLESIEAVAGLSEDAPKRRLLLACAHTYEVYEPFLRGYAAERGFALEIDGLPFGTLAQALRDGRDLGRAVCVLYPWDLAPGLDWYTGLLAHVDTPDRIYSEAKQTLDALQKHPESSLVYVPAPIPPVTSSLRIDARLHSRLALMVAAQGGHVLEGVEFSLDSYVSRGIPASARGLSLIAKESISLRFGEVENVKKVLVTDLDNTLWRGVIDEDGPDALFAEPNGPGHIHFIYQTYLRKLRSEGTLIAVASRNSPADVETGLLGQTAIGKDDFVAVMAGYGTKSSMISGLAEKLNLGLDSFVFVDDNLIEIEEVSTAMPEITCLHFPDHADEFPEFLRLAGKCFDKTRVTEEDQLRAVHYKKRLDSVNPVDLSSDRLRPFLRDQNMRLTVFDRSRKGQARAIQLINKTNQFNMNGRRWSEEEVMDVLVKGGRLLSASLEDRNGSFGEITALLMDAERHALAYAMSCRVFQRRVEHAFLATLSEAGLLPVSFGYETTSRNEPFRVFLSELGVEKPTSDPGHLLTVGIDRMCRPETELFTITTTLA